MMAFRSGAAAAAFIASAALAGETTDALMERCFARVYDEAHLAKHPGQNVTRMTAYFVGFEDDVVAQLSFVTRPGGHLFVVSGECVQDGGSKLACHVCAGDAACEWSDETFGISVAKDRITVVNDTTGITASDLGDDGTEIGDTYQLKAGGESGAFLLTEAAPNSCGQ